MGSAHALFSAFRSAYRGSSSLAKMRVATIAATIYYIWDIRNRKVFENECLNLDSVVRKIQILIHRLHALHASFSYYD